jgi:hypothetical protein
MAGLIAMEMDDDDDDDAIDAPARNALLQAVLLLGERVRLKHGLELNMASAKTPLSAATAGTCVPWKLFEILCALTVLHQAESVRTRRVFHLRGKVPTPVEFVRDGRSRYLWIQHSMDGELSGYHWRPDLVVTDSEFAPTSDNVTEIIEVKHRRHLDSVTVRSEFAKSYDLRVESYLIWSYYDVAPYVAEGATKLGLEIKLVGLAQEDRASFLDPEVLVRNVDESITAARERRQFAARLEEVASRVREKVDRDRFLR